MSHPKKGTPENEIATAKWRRSVTEKYGSVTNLVKESGRKGGLAQNPSKGFGSNNESAVANGKKWGAISKRGHKFLEEKDGRRFYLRKADDKIVEFWL